LQNYGVSLVICDHTMLLATGHKRMHTTLTPNSEGWYSIYLSLRDGRLSWPRYPDQPETEPRTVRSEVQRPSRCIHSVVSHTCCQITPLNHTLCRPEFLPLPKIHVQLWSPWCRPPQIAAARNAHALKTTLTRSVDDDFYRNMW